MAAHELSFNLKHFSIEQEFYVPRRLHYLCSALTKAFQNSIRIGDTFCEPEPTTRAELFALFIGSIVSLQSQSDKVEELLMYILFGFGEYHGYSLNIQGLTLSLLKCKSKASRNVKEIVIKHIYVAAARMDSLNLLWFGHGSMKEVKGIYLFRYLTCFSKVIPIIFLF